MADLADMRHKLMGRVQAVMTACCDYRSAFDHYSYLYGEDTKEFFRQFLLYGHILTAAEIEAHAENGVPESPPTLQQFREQIDSYEKIYEEVNRIEPISIFQSWMKVDARPFKASLLNVIKCVTNAMFEPLKQTVELLKTYEQELPEEVYKQLEVGENLWWTRRFAKQPMSKSELPEKWNNIKKLAIAVKQHVAPLQANEMTVLRKSCAAFDVEQHRFRERFRKEAPFRFDTKKPYQLLDTKHIEIKQMESAMTSIYESAGLFEVMVPDYKQLKQCRKELCLLKELWDMISLVGTCLDDWQTTKWVDINVENMDLECKKFAREIRNLDKEVRAWDAFSGLDSKVKNMLTALKAVAEPQNPAIRERHWNQLMQVTGVRFVMDSDTTLADLLKLNLHNFEDEVRGIVDKAVPEMSMEKVLKELKMTWSTMEFQYEPHPRTNIPLLKSDEELIEILEDNQVQLQNLITSKYIAFFLEEVSIWQRKLSTMDSVISLWFEVQHTWSRLESIFIGSEDIRAQLPEDSKRFEGIDVDFKELAYEAQKTPNVVEATNKPGLSQQLEDIQSRLSLCEKALAEYLDMKRLAFPRFYFVSSADLLDILSNGTNPQLVQRHLSKLFDNLARMKFQLDSEQKPTKVGLGMYSREEEYVSFSEPCDCSGQGGGRLRECDEGISQEASDPAEHPRYHADRAALQGRQTGIMTICTIDVHARDVVAKMITQKVDNAQAFIWLSQLRHRWSDEERHCFANICDAQFLYSYEYLGNTPRLVITPLTDRCYITLTQSLHLTMSGAPAGPAGTGKTETTKDLGRALGIMVYVFNCSEQMDYKNIHLVANWLSSLEKKLEQHSEGSHQDFRVFISAEPAPSPESHIIPQGILENSIKITSKAPTGMHANLHKALDNFNQDTLEMCTRENEFKSILFALCYFHAAVAERRKFGPQGWNRSYPFNTGDLTISVNVLYNYLEASTKVPYDDLRYLFGEIMYGGHITDDWDRRLCKTYLEEFIKPEMLEGELLLAPGFPLPANMDYNGYHQYIDDALPPESPYLDGLHPNAEIGFLTQTSEKLFRTVLEMQPRDTSVGEGGVGTRDETVKALLEEMLEKLMDEFNIAELMAKVEERTPYAVVAFQECERMNILTSEIKRSLKELDLGLKDKDDRDWDFLRTSKPSSGPQKMPVKRGTERSSETTAEQSSRKELPPRQTPLRTVAPVQRRKTSMFEDAEGDDLLDVLRRGKGPKKE
ncbi:hypothetical protein Q9233_014119 [Columba guinea]|nr:hypothetical protein Q9233_014119 [Columba guinea]